MDKTNDGVKVGTDDYLKKKATINLKSVLQHGVEGFVLEAKHEAKKALKEAIKEQVEEFKQDMMNVDGAREAFEAMGMLEDFDKLINEGVQELKAEVAARAAAEARKVLAEKERAIQEALEAAEKATKDGEAAMARAEAAAAAAEGQGGAPITSESDAALETASEARDFALEVLNEKREMLINRLEDRVTTLFENEFNRLIKTFTDVASIDKLIESKAAEMMDRGGSRKRKGGLKARKNARNKARQEKARVQGNVNHAVEETKADARNAAEEAEQEIKEEVEFLIKAQLQRLADQYLSEMRAKIMKQVIDMMLPLMHAAIELLPKKRSNFFFDCPLVEDLLNFLATDGLQFVGEVATAFLSSGQEGQIDQQTQQSMKALNTEDREFTGLANEDLPPLQTGRSQQGAMVQGHGGAQI